MSVTKLSFIESLYKIMCTATSTASDNKIKNNDYFKRRVLGFRAEIEFSNYIKSISPKIALLDGGHFISSKLSGLIHQKNSFIYTTVSDKNPDDFIEIYKIISAWDEVTHLMYIKFDTDTDTWGDTELLLKKVENKSKTKEKIIFPNYSFYTFTKNKNEFSLATNQDFSNILNHFPKPKKEPSVFHLRKREQFNYFSEYELPIIKNIYANRYFLDVVLRKASGRQIIDFDGFLKVKDKFNIIEIKEKAPILNDSDDPNKWQYGWDSRRILWYLYVQKKLNLNVIYNVRQINNREDREFIKWDSILLDEFLKGVGWSNSRSGGGGEDTLLAPYSYFKNLKNIISST